MEIKDALEYAQILKGAIVRDNGWGINTLGATVCENYTSKILMYSEDSKQFMNLLLNTFIDVHNSLSKTLEEDEDLKDAYIKYGEPFVHALQKSAKEHTHNFVQQWLDQHREDEKLQKESAEEHLDRSHNFVQEWLNQHENDDKHLIDFGPANKEPETDDPEESEEDIPQIVINIGQLNINFPAEEGSEQSTKTYNVILEDAGAAKLQVAKAIKMACSYTIPEAKALVDLTSSIIAVNIPLDKAEKLKKIVETQGAVASIKEFSK